MSPLPAIGQPWPTLPGSAYAGITTSKDGQPYALVLLADKPNQKLNWQAGLAWAQGLNADLPSRPEGALLFANLAIAFDKEWHWTNEQFSGAGYSWFQDFDDGYQYYYDKSDEGRVRAVRRLPLDHSILSSAAS